MSNKLYVIKGKVVDHNHHIAYIKLLKVLFRLEVIDEDTAIELVLEFRPFFV
jgi:hypothetical protein